MWFRGICNYCKQKTDDNSCVCDPCYENVVKKEMEEYNAQTSVIQKRLIPGYGYMSEGQWNEIGRRVSYYEPDGFQRILRRGENGKIQDREPDYA